METERTLIDTGSVNQVKSVIQQIMGTLTVLELKIERFSPEDEMEHKK